MDHFMEAAEQTRSDTKSIWIGLIVGFLAVGAISINDYRRRQDFTDLLVVPIIVSLLWFFFLSKSGRRRSLKSSLKAHLGDSPSIAEWNVGEDGLFIAGSRGINSHYPWQAVILVVKRPLGLLIYINKQTSFWLPVASFTSAEDLPRVLEIANQKGRTVITDSDPKGFLQKAEYFPKT